MAKKQTFADKMISASDVVTCPVCNVEKKFIQNTGVCKCNEKEIYA
jgi:hypothetical protein